MSLTAHDVQKIAHLARLGINAEDIDAYANSLSGILDLVAEMNTLDTEQTSPMAHPLNQVQRLRADVITEVNQREHFQALAPQIEAGLYLVPKVIE
ncbi:MAG: Asp-tRNA(Asn)/Glu-tRNA(Gln) amidotransferase subunit GatC [Methylococcales bacterium]|nr:Asp-tRNA(Asn)/Glu-tRNA(Gln) amidotransferase subunit GatC [Methylococcales bacterium]